MKGNRGIGCAEALNNHTPPPDLLGPDARTLDVPSSAVERHVPDPVLAPGVVPLDPQRLSAEAEARVAAILADELAANTRRTLCPRPEALVRLACRTFRAAAAVTRTGRGRGAVHVDFAAHEIPGPQGVGWGSALPPELDAHLLKAGLKSAAGPWALNAVETRVAALAAAHRWKGLPSPSGAPRPTRSPSGWPCPSRRASSVGRSGGASRASGTRAPSPKRRSTTSSFDARARWASPGAVMAHSLRAGYVTEALARNLPLAKIMDKTGHETLHTLRHYKRPEIPN